MPFCSAPLLRAAQLLSAASSATLDIHSSIKLKAKDAQHIAGLHKKSCAKIVWCLISMQINTKHVTR